MTDREKLDALNRDINSTYEQLSSYNNIVVLIDRSPAVCYTIWDAVDWFMPPTA